MRTNVIFHHQEAFVPVSEENGILAVSDAQWFITLLRCVPGLQIDDTLCQEDWGVVAFVRRNEKQFWIELSTWPNGEHAWLAHVHHGSFGWLQRFSTSGNKEMERVVSDIHDVVAGDSAISAISWYEEGEMNKAHPHGYPTPNEG